MKAVVLKANRSLAYTEIPTPEAGPGEVRIRVAVCGICGSDLPRVYDAAARRYPIVLGHEFSGTVDAVGTGVKGLSPGTHVVAAPLIPCGKCRDCAAGNYALCRNYDFIGSRRNGAMADYVTVPAANVIPITRELPFTQAATIEPATVALHAFRHAGFAGGHVAILGCGIIGLYAVQWARILGAASVTVIGRGQTGLITAQALGAEARFSTLGLAEDALPEGVRDSGYEYVFECSGADRTMKLALSLVSKKGTVCYVGTPKRDLRFSVPLWEQLNRKECILTGTWMSYSAPFPGEEWERTLREMEQGGLRFVSGMISGVFPMSDAAAAFDTIHTGNAKGRVLLQNAPEDG